MPSKKDEALGKEGVDAYMAALDHSLKPVLEAVRSTILGASFNIAEGIKWNCPSFRTSDWFATASIRKNVVFIVMHFGAKVKVIGAAGVGALTSGTSTIVASTSSATLGVDDPAGLLKWLAKDRATVEFVDMAAFEAKRDAYRAIVQQWIGLIP